MSATNWGECPACLRRAHEAKAKQQQETAEAYGKIPVEEYLLMRAESEKEVKIDDTLREDYCQGMTEAGKYYVHYRGECQNADCSFLHEFTHEEDVLAKMMAAKPKRR